MSSVRIEVAGRSVQVREDLSIDSTGAKVWNTSIVLLRHLEKMRRKLKYDQPGRRVLELGAGCGLLGISLASMGWHVTVTDMAVMLPLLRENVAQARSSVATTDEQDASSNTTRLESGGTLTVRELCWGETDLSEFNGPFDCIVGTDVVFLERLVDPLINTLDQLGDTSTNVFICIEPRNAVAYDMFLKRAEQLYDIKQLTPDAEFRDDFVKLFQLRKRFLATSSDE
ncbi:hypothetical protein CAOG_04355 [Capsaspora owczarzaki ATCC 30864]|uniref:Uncharacterized protein n=1 Tax=Capsaspora owczarzaki (strain ATCC 30864) TaxID=595528 RepID=A0A0D2UER2_CAPO3|nr:hypothetical protein CAOG_04355 [Capsaspora owczarzaki ATCC 30864]KJE93591.1 hypothetical protein CAOG_004355 [Capsaspora owczarzaki ATCC 30864]|eukprot:XP_004348183.1 hypothetical protein CAOG_04355 [Capsaspora owczarzaki ATCC 30864]